MIIRTTPSNVTTTSSTTSNSRKRGTAKNTSTTRKTTDETDEERTLHDDDNDDDDHVSNSTPTTTTSSPKNDDERKSSSTTTSTKQRQHKGPKRLLTGRPKRARSAYNYFFRSERAKFMGVSEEMLDEEENSKQYKRKHRKTPGMIGFANLASVVGQKWKDLSSEEKEIFEEKARQDKQRFDKELAIWKEKQQQKQKENAVVPAYYGRDTHRDVVDYNHNTHPANMSHRPQRVLSSALIWEQQRPQGGGPPAPYYGPNVVSAAPSYPPYGGPPNHPRPYLRQPYPYHPPTNHHPHPHQHPYYAPSSSHPRPHFREPHQYGSWDQTPTSHVDVVPNAITSCDSTCSSLSACTNRGPPASSSAPTSPYQSAPSGAVHQHRSPPAVHSQEPILLDAEHRYQYPPTKRGRYDLPSQAGHHHHHPQAQRPCYNYRYPYHPDQAQQGAYGPPLPSQVSSGADPRETRQGSFTSGTEEEAEGSGYWDVPSEAAVASGYYNHQGTDMQRHIESDPRQQATPAPEEGNVGAPSHMTKWREVINEQREGHQQAQAMLAVNQEQEPRRNITAVAATTNEEENREFVSNTLLMDVKAEEQDEALFSPLSHEEPTPSTIPPRMMLDLLNPPNVYLAREDQGTNQACSRMVDGTSNTVVLTSEVAPTASNVHTDVIEAPCNVQSAAATSIVTECKPDQVSMQCPTAATAAHSGNGDNNMNGNLDCPFTLKPCASTDSADSHTSNTSAKAREDMLQFLSLICD